ncbi:Choline transpo domain containing protein [Trichuris trichiura]|uniref:Choline transporter-like protein n=1 Tax=Trichuris trichiura TaxID=36087 RepID=A0A077Z2B3_TRITR|nr:Choline transpo domain containing protein [Trichuris trichiura]
MEYESAAAQVKVTDSRKCTNVPWCFVYGIAWAVMFAFIVWAFLKGDYKRLHSGADDRGNVCGSDKMLNNATETFENKKYMFPMSFASPIKSLWICVEMCPNETIQNRTMLARFASKYKVKLCDYHVPIAEYENEQKYPSAVNGTCPVMPILKSKPILNRCSPRIPKIKNEYYALPTLKYENYLANMCQDLSNTSTFIFFMTLSGLVMTIVLWVCSFQNLEHWQISYVNMSSLNATITYDRSDIMYGAIAFTIFTILVCTVTVLMWSYMPFINAVFKQARTTLFFMPLLLILPVFSALTIIAMTLLFGFSFVSTITIVLAEMKKPRLLNVFKEAAKFGNAQIPVPFLFIFYICLYVWTCECMVAFQCLAISIPVANRLFNKNKSHKWFLGIQGVFIVLRYHVGSVIFAGALVALLRLFRTALTYIESKSVRRFPCRAKGCKQKLAKCATCITVATSLLRISNSATMAVIAVDGSNYCAAASNAGALIGGNLGKFGATYALCSAYMWIGKVIISITNAFIASAIFKTDEEINNYITPTIAVGLATYVLGGVFFNVFQSIVSTLAICYCIVQTEARLLRIKYFTSEQIDMYENMRDGDQADPSNTESLVEVKQPEKVRKESAGSSAYSDGRSHTSENRS